MGGKLFQFSSLVTKLILEFKRGVFSIHSRVGDVEKVLVKSLEPGDGRGIELLLQGDDGSRETAVVGECVERLFGGEEIPTAAQFHLAAHEEPTNQAER